MAIIAENLKGKARTLVGLASLALMVSACATDAGEPPADEAAPPEELQEDVEDSEAEVDLSGQTLHVQYWPTEREWIEKLFIEPFEEKTGARVVTSFGATGETVAKVGAQQASPELDVVFMDDRGAVQLSNEGLLAPLADYDVPLVNEIPEQFILGDGTGAGFAIYDNILLYNTQMFDSPPDTWEVLFDPEYAGQVALPPIEWGNGLMLLETFARLEGTTMAEGEERVWERVEQLEPQVGLFFEDFALTSQLFESNDLALGVLQPTVFKPYIEEGAPLAPAWDVPYWGVGVITTAIVNNHPASNALVEEFLNVVLSQSALQQLADEFLFGVTVAGVEVGPEVADWASTGERLEKTFTQDFDLVAERSDEWADRWNAIFAR